MHLQPGWHVHARNAMQSAIALPNQVLRLATICRKSMVILRSVSSPTNCSNWPAFAPRTSLIRISTSQLSMPSESTSRNSMATLSSVCPRKS